MKEGVRLSANRRQKGNRTSISPAEKVALRGTSGQHEPSPPRVRMEHNGLEPTLGFNETSS
jgi:hypothetical protein